MNSSSRFGSSRYRSAPTTMSSAGVPPSTRRSNLLLAPAFEDFRGYAVQNASNSGLDKSFFFLGVGYGTGYGADELTALRSPLLSALLRPR